jgi:hypothetical protein
MLENTRVIVYRVVGKGIALPSSNWHRYFACHLSKKCAMGKLRRHGRMVRQAYTLGQVPYFMRCSHCWHRRSTHGWVLIRDTQEIQQMIGAWMELHDTPYTTIIQPCPVDG